MIIIYCPFEIMALLHYIITGRYGRKTIPPGRCHLGIENTHILLMNGKVGQKIFQWRQVKEINYCRP